MVIEDNAWRDGDEVTKLLVLLFWFPPWYGVQEMKTQELKRSSKYCK